MENVFRRYWTPTEEQKLFAAIRARSGLAARRDAAWLRLLIATGFRIGEFARSSVADAQFALEQGWFFVPRERRKGGQVDHQVPVTRPVEQVLRELLAVHRAMGGSGEPAAPLVLSRKHRALSVRQYQERVAHWCAAAGVERGSPHWARHTRAMRIMRLSTSSDPRGIAQAALGHASLDATEIYTRPTKEDLQRELALIDGARRVPKRALRRLYEERRAA